MTDFDSIWRTQDEIRTVVNAVLGECIWNLSYNERRMAIELELTVSLDDDAIDELSSQFLKSLIMMELAQKAPNLYSILINYSSFYRTGNPISEIPRESFCKAYRDFMEQFTCVRSGHRCRG